MEITRVKNLFHKIRQEEVKILSEQNLFDDSVSLKSEAISERHQDLINTLTEDEKLRIKNEFTGLGPIAPLIEDEAITEILINNYQTIYFEKKGSLIKSDDHFFDEQSYLHFIEKLASLCKTYINTEKPFIETQWGTLRVTVIFPDLARGSFLVSIRKQPLSPWTLEKLSAQNWANEIDLNQIKTLIQNRQNFLVVGGTGSGKTSLLQSIIHEIGEDERSVIIEDTQELNPLYPQNSSLLTRYDIQFKNNNVTMNDLIKRALRLRPDRICVGEIRGEEATALLMALATGHDGSFGTLHARTAQEALLRLEMLVQMGAPQWSLQSIRRLIALTVHTIIVVGKTQGQRQLQGLYQISSVEDTGFTLHRYDSKAER